MLIANIHEKKTHTQQRKQNIEMMRLEPQEDGPSVNIVMRSSIATGEDKGKEPEKDGWVRKVVDK